MTGVLHELRKHQANKTIPVRDDSIVVKDASAMALAEMCLREIGLGTKGQRVARWAGIWWRYHDGHHRVLDGEALRAELWRVLRRVIVEGVDEKTQQPIMTRLHVTSRAVSEVADAMTAVVDRVDATADIPCALPGYDGPDPRYVAVVRNGLVDLAKNDNNETRLHPPTPRLFATAGAAVDYDADALCPSWDHFLFEIFTEEGKIDQQSIRLVRQIFGWLISGDTSRHKIPLFIGPPRSGKSTMMTILRALLGEANVCAPPLASLGDSRFGLAPLIGKSAAIIPDARLGSKADQAAVAGLLLAASGRDPIEVDRKNRDAVTTRLHCRILIVTNVLPRIGDESGALAGRYLVVETRQSFIGREDLTLESRLLAELPGILRWAIAGWRDLQRNGWVVPDRTKEIIDELDRLGSPIKAFVADRLEVRSGPETAIDELYAQWTSWCEASGRKEPGTVQTFARDLRAAVPAVRVRQRDGETLLENGKRDRRRVYSGLAIKEAE